MHTLVLTTTEDKTVFNLKIKDRDNEFVYEKKLFLKKVKNINQIKKDLKELGEVKHYYRYCSYAFKNLVEKKLGIKPGFVI